MPIDLPLYNIGPRKLLQFINVKNMNHQVGSKDCRMCLAFDNGQKFTSLFADKELREKFEKFSDISVSFVY